MKPPRFSIAWIMAIVVVVAIDFAAYRALRGMASDSGVLILLGSMPMMSLLMLGVASLAGASPGKGGYRPFLIGFEAVGWPILLAYTGCAILFPGSLGEDLVAAIQSLPIDLGTPFWQGWPGVVGEVLLLLTPQLAFALVGGWLNQSFEIRVSLKRRRATGLGAEAEGPHPGRGVAEVRPLGSSA